MDTQNTAFPQILLTTEPFYHDISPFSKNIPPKNCFIDIFVIRSLLRKNTNIYFLFRGFLLLELVKISKF